MSCLLKNFIRKIRIKVNRRFDVSDIIFKTDVVYRRGSRGGKMGEFSPSLFLSSLLSFSFFPYSSNIEIKSPPFQNPGSAPGLCQCKVVFRVEDFEYVNGTHSTVPDGYVDILFTG